MKMRNFLSVIGTGIFLALSSYADCPDEFVKPVPTEGVLKAGYYLIPTNDQFPCGIEVRPIGTENGQFQLGFFSPWKEARIPRGKTDWYDPSIARVAWTPSNRANTKHAATSTPSM